MVVASHVQAGTSFLFPRDAAILLMVCSRFLVVMLPSDVHGLEEATDATDTTELVKHMLRAMLFCWYNELFAALLGVEIYPVELYATRRELVGNTFWFAATTVLCSSHAGHDGAVLELRRVEVDSAELYRVELLCVELYCVEFSRRALLRGVLPVRV